MEPVGPKGESLFRNRDWQRANGVSGYCISIILVKFQNLSSDRGKGRKFVAKCSFGLLCLADELNQ